MHKLNLIASGISLSSVLVILGLSQHSMAATSENQVRLQAYVPIECEANLRVDLQEVSVDTFKLGTLSQFCNTGYQMTLNYAGDANGAQFRLRDRVVNVSPQQTLIEMNGKPVNGQSDIFLSNANRPDAEQIARSLSVSVTPSGI